MNVENATYTQRSRSWATDRGKVEKRKESSYKLAVNVRVGLGLGGYVVIGRKWMSAYYGNSINDLSYKCCRVV